MAWRSVVLRSVVQRSIEHSGPPRTGALPLRAAAQRGHGGGGDAPRARGRAVGPGGQHERPLRVMLNLGAVSEREGAAAGKAWRRAGGRVRGLRGQLCVRAAAREAGRDGTITPVCALHLCPPIPLRTHRYVLLQNSAAPIIYTVIVDGGALFNHNQVSIAGAPVQVATYSRYNTINRDTMLYMDY